MKARLLGLCVLVLGLVVISTLTLAAAPAGSAAPSLLRDYPGWVQVNSSGFGDPLNEIWSMAVFSNHIYAGTSNDAGATVWRSPSGRTWTEDVIPHWSPANVSVMDEEVFGSFLYLGTVNENGAEIWRSNGSAWENVIQSGFADANNIAVSTLCVFGGNLYAVTGNLSSGLKVWRSATGSPGSWSPLPIGAMGGSGAMPETTMDVYGGYLYLGFSRNNRAELWRTSNGTLWTPILTGTQTVSNTHVSAMAEFGDDFYIGFRNPDGGQVWRSSNGVSFTPVISDGLGSPNNSRAYGLLVFDDKLYLVLGNVAGGAEVWRSADGATWEPVAQGGWGDGQAGLAGYFDKAAVVFDNRFYIATVNGPSGGEIWQKTISADFSAGPTTGIPPLAVQFSNASAGDYTTSQWSFGDGASSTLANPSHTYLSLGVYTVTLTIGDGVETSTLTRTHAIDTFYRILAPLIMSDYGGGG